MFLVFLVILFWDLTNCSKKAQSSSSRPAMNKGQGFAADAYARLQGLGAVCVTYSVGGLKIANTTAQAFAEKVSCGGHQRRTGHSRAHQESTSASQSS